MLIAMLYGSIEKAECSMGGKYSSIHSVERCVQTNTQNERTQTNVRKETLNERANIRFAHGRRKKDQTFQQTYQRKKVDGKEIRIERAS